MNMKKFKIFLIIFFAMFIGINVQAEDACYACGGTNAATYYWAAQNPNSTNCSKDTTKTQAECTGTVSAYSCYVCGGSNNASYYWAIQNPNSNTCTKDSTKSQSECKGSSNENGTSDTTGDYIPPNEVDNSNDQEADIEPISYIACGSLNDVPESLPRFVRNLVNVLKIAIPILIIIMGMIDFAKTVTFTGDPKDPPFKKFFRRLITGVLAFFIVSLVQFVFGSIKDSEENILGCVSCFISSEDSCTASGENQILVASSCKSLCNKTEDPNDSASVDACMNRCEDEIEACDTDYKACKDAKESNCKTEYNACKKDTYTYEKATIAPKK